MDIHYPSVFFIGWMTLVSGEKVVCPLSTSITPCKCFSKSGGMDVTCESISTEDMRSSLASVAMSKFHVWYLKIRHCPLPTFPESLLGNMRVSHIIASSCNISTVADIAFEGVVDDLESLDLTQNLLVKVPTAALENLVNLTFLSLSYNKIEALHDEAFKGLISLLTLSLYGNKIKVVDSLAFEGIGGNLTQVNLGNNRLRSIPCKPLKNLAVLQKLHVHENRIVAVEPEGFQGMGENLDLLELSNNLLESLPARAFAHLGMLTSLDLEHNNITRIHKDAFTGVERSLEWIKLGANDLDSVPTHALENLSLLRQLDLRQNNISRITGDDFRKFGQNLKFLHLQKNRIHTIETSAFFQLHSLEWLYLSQNHLTTVSYLRPVLDTLKVLDIHDNPFECDCDIMWFRDWMRQGNGSTDVSLPRETLCASPPRLKKIAITDLSREALGCASCAYSHTRVCNVMVTSITLAIGALVIVNTWASISFA